MGCCTSDSSTDSGLSAMSDGDEGSVEWVSDLLELTDHATLEDQEKQQVCSEGTAVGGARRGGGGSFITRET